MKDPLQTSETPYEVLSVEPGVSDQELRKAYFEVIRQRKVPAARATELYNILRNPVERARIALTQYDPNTLRLLIPCPIDDNQALQVGHRAATAKAWESHLKNSFPEAGTIHSIAVQWYWWTQHEEQRYSLIVDAVRDGKDLARGRTGKHSLLRSIGRGNGYDCDPENRRSCSHRDCPWRADCRSPAPPLEKMWQKVVAYWCTLAVTTDFWTGLGGLTKPQTDELSTSFLDSLHSQLLDLAQQYAGRLRAGDQGSSDASIHWGWGGMTEALQKALARQDITTIGAILRASEETLTCIRGIDGAKAVEIKEYARKMRRRNADLPEEYRMLAQLLRTEQRTAEAVIEVGVQRRNGKGIRCGVLMLTDLGYLDAVKNSLEARLVHVQDNPKLQALRQHLSRHVHIVLLLEEDKAEAALEAIECLSDEERRSNDVRDLRARAYDVIAQQKVSVERYMDALDFWGEALRTGSTQSLLNEIRARVISSCKAPAASLQRTQPDKIIPIIEKALTIVSDNDLKLILGDTLAIQAVDQVNAASREVQQAGVTPELVARVKGAVHNLEKGARLGSKMAQDNLDASQQFLKSVTCGMLSLPREALECATKGNEAAQQQQWKEAIRWFRAAMEKAGREVPDDLKKSLAGCLANDAVTEINRAMTGYAQVVQRHDQDIEVFLGLTTPAAFGNLAAYISLRSGHDMGPSCVHCGCGGGRLGLPVAYGQQQWATFNHPKHGQLKLCQSCAAKLQDLLNQRPQPSHDVIIALQAAAQELYEAVYLDPSGPYPSKSLADLRTLASNVNITLPSQPTWRATKPTKKPPRMMAARRESQTGPPHQKQQATHGKTSESAEELDRSSAHIIAAFIVIVITVLIVGAMYLAIVWGTGR